MTDATKYLPYFLRAARHGVKPVGWSPAGSTHKSVNKFIDVSKEPSLKNTLIDQRAARAVNIDITRAMNIREGDLVRVLYGRDAGNSGIVNRILRGSNQVIVGGCNLVKSYLPSEGEKQYSESLPQQMVVEAPIHVTNVVPLDPVVKRPTRIKARYSMSGECVRISKLSGCAMPDGTSTVASPSQRALQSKSWLKSNVRRGAPLGDRTVESWKDDQSQFRSLRARLGDLSVS